MKIKPGTYRHYKGGLYEVKGVGRIEANNEEMVVYTSLQSKGGFKKGSIWLRPTKIFTEKIIRNGITQPRFSRIMPTFAPVTATDLFRLGIFPFLVFMINFIAYSMFWIESDRWNLDTPMHFLGGLSIAYSTHYLLSMLEKRDFITIKSRLVKILILIASVALAAVMWEIYEFASDTFLGTHFQPNNFDTMKDLLMGTLGGTIFSLLESVFTQKSNTL